jgi:pepF/M3 family oligoendopeptidase
MAINPRWDLSTVYLSLDSKEFKADFERFEQEICTLEKLFDTGLQGPAAGSSLVGLSEAAAEFIDLFNAVSILEVTLSAYIYGIVSTDSRDAGAARQLSEFQVVDVRLQKVFNRFQAWVGKLGGGLDMLLNSAPTLQAHAFILREMSEQSRYLLSDAEENLAADLNLSSGIAWSKLQETVTSQLTVDLDLDGKIQRLPVAAVVNLHSHPDETIRRKAYVAELAAWRTVEETLAACLNGIKGQDITLNRHRGRADSLQVPLVNARIDRETLDAMLAAMQASLPAFHRYFHAKARLLGKENLAWYDLFAPVGRSERVFTLAEARDFIADNFEKFSPELGAFIRRAFDNRWIDAEQRDGKSSLGYCTILPAVKESRVLVNFDGSLDQVSIIAHELGHAFHNECVFQAGKTMLQMSIPNTLAETASIMNQTAITEAFLAGSSDPGESLGILETQLIENSVAIVDIYSRFLFEKEFFERREKAELSAAEICQMMEKYQKFTYGSGLDEDYLNGYMWTWKHHYYSPGYPFYNFPYAFGLLFGLRLYGVYMEQGPSFFPAYKALLADSGMASPADLAARFGYDLRSQNFWKESLAIIERSIDRYCELSAQVAADPKTPQ